MARRPTPIVRDADVLLRRGMEAVEYGRIEEAVGMLRQASEIEPDSHDVFLVLGIALIRAVEMSEAIAALETAITLDPKSFYAHFRLAEAYLRVGVPTRGKEYLDQAMQLSESVEQRKMVRELLALDAKRGARRIWRPDFTKLLRRKGPEK